jgi:hypothetical protein
MQLVLAIADSQIVGALSVDSYVGAESKWPKGWNELIVRGVQFDVLDVDMPDEMVCSMLKTYRPNYEDNDE